MNKQNPPPTNITTAQGKTLIMLARQTIAHKLGLSIPDEDRQKIESVVHDSSLKQTRGTFVTLHRHGKLRGCIGSIVAVESILENIRHNAINAAFGDPRFPPLQKKEFNELDIGVSILTDPKLLAYENGNELLSRLRPRIDGVILRDGLASATFLPQVWEQLPRTEDFLSHLCIKAGLASNAWQTGKLEVFTYQAQCFSE